MADEAAVVVSNGVEETKKPSRSRSVSKHSEDSHNGSRHRGGRAHEHPSGDEESDAEAASVDKQENGDAEERYDPTKTDDEAELSPSHNELSNGDNIVNADYQSNNEEE